MLAQLFLFDSVPNSHYFYLLSLWKHNDTDNEIAAKNTKSKQRNEEKKVIVEENKVKIIIMEYSHTSYGSSESFCSKEWTKRRNEMLKSERKHTQKWTKERYRNREEMCVCKTDCPVIHQISQFR